jgi:spermidine synthase
MTRFSSFKISVIALCFCPLVYSSDAIIPVALADVAVEASSSAFTSKSHRSKNITNINVFEQIAKSDQEANNANNNDVLLLENNVDSSEAGVMEAQRAKASIRYVEDIAPGLKLDMDLHSILHTSTSAVQSVQIIDSYFGRTLVTDGKTQSAEHDEFVYHESLVHPAMFWSAHLSSRGNKRSNKNNNSINAPKSVFIGGGGELATAREVLRHNTVDRVVMVDIDPEVIEVSRKYLPEWGGDAVLHHPKVEYIIGDVHQYLAGTDETFDVMIIDVSDPIEAGPAVALYTQEFYKLVSQRLNKHGVFVTQAGSASFIPFAHTSLG